MSADAPRSRGLRACSSRPRAAATPQTAYSVKRDGDDNLYSLELATGAPPPRPDRLRRRRVARLLSRLRRALRHRRRARRPGRLRPRQRRLRPGRPAGARRHRHRPRLRRRRQALHVDRRPEPPRLYQIDLVSGRADVVGDQGSRSPASTGALPPPGCPSGLYGLEGDADPPPGSPGGSTASTPATARRPPSAGWRPSPRSTAASSSAVPARSGGSTTGEVFTVNARDRARHRRAPRRRRRGAASRAWRSHDGTCSGLPLQAPLEIPAAGPWALAALVLALAACALACARRLPPAAPPRAG